MHECYLQNQDTRSRNHWCVVIAHLVLALTADVGRLFELKTMSSFSWIYNLETINGKFAFISRWNVQVLLDMRIFVSREMLFYPSCKMAWCLANHPAQINWYTTRDFNASGLRSLKLKKIISILKEEKTILMSISLQKTSNKCFSFLRVTVFVEKSPTNGSLKYRIPVVFTPVVEVLFWVDLNENLFSYPLMILSMRWLGEEICWRVIDSCWRSFSRPVVVLSTKKILMWSIYAAVDESEEWLRHGFKSRWSPDSFRLLLSNCLNWKTWTWTLFLFKHGKSIR